MKVFRKQTKYFYASLAFFLTVLSSTSHAADKALLDILLENGAINKEQHGELMKKESLSSKDFGATEKMVEKKVDEALAKKVDEEFPVKVSHGKKGFRFESKDGNWQTNLQWRAQLRYTTPTTGDPRSLGNFTTGISKNTFEARRLRMKIGGHGFRPWLGYYFEVDLQPTRDSDDSGANASSRVIDWRITADKWDWLALRLGQWKIDYNRERVDSSGRQQFVERSIANRIFTIDRQVGAQIRGRLFKETPADLRYWAGVFTGEGRGVRNDDEDLMYMGRLQWNFLGRDLKWRQTDVERTKKPTGSLSFSAATNTGRCTRWSSSGCGNLSGFASPATASDGQYKVEQVSQGFAFKYNGLSIQEELHWKSIDDTANNTTSDLTGGYVQAGYFFHELLPSIPKELEFAARYAFVNEPNSGNIAIDNTREEFTLGANWFFAGHNNKVTLDYSHLTLDDGVANRDVNDDRFRVQWDVSF